MLKEFIFEIGIVIAFLIVVGLLAGILLVGISLDALLWPLLIIALILLFVGFVILCVYIIGKEGLGLFGKR